MSKNRKKEEKKDREHALETMKAVHTGDGPCTLTVELNTITGECGASRNGVMEYGEIGIKKGYSGEKKWKVDNSLPFSHKEAWEVSYAFDNYDLVCAIDTNSIIINGLQITVGSLFDVIQDADGERYWSNFREEFIDHYPDEIKDFEQRNWIKGIEFIQKNHKEATKVLIIVDSDYENHIDYNSGNKKICDEYQLPAGFTLVYASSDRGDDWMNKLFKCADKYNKERIASIKQKGTF